jgi:hypothetical protein
MGNGSRRQADSGEEEEDDDVDMLVHPDDARIAREWQAAENASMYKMYPNKFKYQELTVCRR